MAFTSTDLTNIERAIVELASGERVVSVQINGKRTEFAQAQLPELRALRAEVKADVSAASGSSRFFLVQTTKGL